jgi:hypothetical protein
MSRKLGDHAHRLIESYERWLEDKPQLDILRLTGYLTDRQTRLAIAALLANPPIPGLTDRLQSSGHDRMFAVKNVRKALLTWIASKSSRSGGRKIRRGVAMGIKSRIERLNCNGGCLGVGIATAGPADGARKATESRHKAGNPATLGSQATVQTNPTPFLGSYCCSAVVLAVRKHFEDKAVSRPLAWPKRKPDLHRTGQTGSHRKLDRATSPSLGRLSFVDIEYLL